MVENNKTKTKRAAKNGTDQLSAKSAATILKDAWPKVRPATNKFPCRTEAPFQDQELPLLTLVRQR
jgi:hypothetical protein